MYPYIQRNENLNGVFICSTNWILVKIYYVYISSNTIKYVVADFRTLNIVLCFYLLNFLYSEKALDQFISEEWKWKTREQIFVFWFVGLPIKSIKVPSRSCFRIGWNFYFHSKFPNDFPTIASELRHLECF